MNEKKKDFIDFIVDAKDDEAFFLEFMTHKSPEALKALFDRKYGENRHIIDCDKLADAKVKLGLNDLDEIPPSY